MMAASPNPNFLNEHMRVTVESIAGSRWKAEATILSFQFDEHTGIRIELMDVVLIEGCADLHIIEFTTNQILDHTLNADKLCFRTATGASFLVTPYQL